MKDLWRGYGKAALLLGAVMLGAAVFYWQVSEAQAPDKEIWGMADAKETAVNSKMSGRVVKICVKEGDTVKKGQLLARIDRDMTDTDRIQAEAAVRAQEASVRQAAITTAMSRGTLSAQLHEAEAKAAQAESALQLAMRDEERYRTLLNEDAVSARQYDTVRTRLAAAEAARDGAAATVASAKAALAQSDAQAEGEQASREQAEALRGKLDAVAVNEKETEIRAPFDGVVTKKYVEEGSLISPSVPLFSVQDTRDNWVEFKVKETDLSRYTLGEVLTLKGRNEALQIPGHIESISRKADYATVKATSERGDKDIVAFTVKVRTDSDKVWPGMRFRLPE